RFDDVLAGEVWICCGQSNMQMGHNRIPDIAALVEETIAAKRPVRTLQISQNISFSEEERTGAEWSTTPPDSAVAAAFACKLQAAIDVPVAVVVAAWGSSSLEGWMPAALTEELPHFAAMMEDHLADTTITDMIIAANAGTPTITNYSKDPKENAQLTKKHRAANIYARTRPNMLYNAMLHPIIPMAAQGMVYYQGEANTRSTEDMLQYSTSQRAWLELLRKRTGRDDWRFLSVMLPGFARSPNVDLEAVDITTWSTMRDHQLKILELPHTAVACTIDLGDAKDIHPKDKFPIGERLALLARRDTCGETGLLAQGPTFAGMKKEGSSITVQFDHAKGLSTSDGESPKAFWVSDGDNQWYRAGARIEGEAIILTAPEGITPKHARYAFAAKPVVNLINEAGLPAYPFTTD
ncbi:MAG: sialate O-acetylesterase, partial [Verrucomicrobiales bacterium]|nr:sialate O-acetylesterase [Verrucomicrobiales bacterium]